jgi:tetratricopeptide (TPR) repeat protein
MKQLEEYSTRTHNSTCPIVVLLGMGGQGKSQLTMEFCKASKAAGKFQAIFWIDVTSNNSLSRSFNDIIAKISDSAPALESITSRAAYVKDIIESWNFPWLLVFDNYDRPDEVLRISSYFPQSSFGNIIVTSRHADSKRLGNTIQVTGMTEDESIDLIFARSELERTRENVCEAKAVVGQLGYLPLAVDQAGAYISAQSLSMSLFSKHYKERKANILKYTPSLTEYRKKLNGSDAETALNVFTTLELSLQAIPGSTDTRAAIEDFLTLSAFYNNITIGEDLAKTAATVSHPPSWLRLFLSEDAWDHFKYQDTLANLNRLSLLQSLSPGDVTYFSLHPLVVDWLKLRRDTTFGRAYTLLSGAVLEEIILHEDTDAMQLGPRQYLLAHMDSCLHNQRLYLHSSDFIDEEVLERLHTYGLFLERNNRYDDAEEMYRRTLQGKEKVLGLEHTSTFDTANNLGVLYKNQGKLKEAEEMYQRALQGREKVLGLEHVRTLNTIENLGNLYERQGKLKEAEEMFQRALEGYKKTLGVEHIETLETFHNIATLYYSQGRSKETEEMYRRSLEGKEKVLGIENASVFRTVDSLGIFYEREGRLEEAEEMYQRALQGYEKIYGVDHPITLQTASNLGDVYNLQGRQKEASEMHQRALLRKDKVLFVEHPSDIPTTKNLEPLSNVSRGNKTPDIFRRLLASRSSKVT